jgi:hypothetical protein
MDGPAGTIPGIHQDQCPIVTLLLFPGTHCFCASSAFASSFSISLLRLMLSLRISGLTAPVLRRMYHAGDRSNNSKSISLTPLSVHTLRLWWLRLWNASSSSVCHPWSRRPSLHRHALALSTAGTTMCTRKCRVMSRSRCSICGTMLWNIGTLSFDFTTVM